MAPDGIDPPSPAFQAGANPSQLESQKCRVLDASPFYDDVEPLTPDAITAYLPWTTSDQEELNFLCQAPSLARCRYAMIRRPRLC